MASWGAAPNTAGLSPAPRFGLRDLSCGPGPPAHETAASSALLSEVLYDHAKKFKAATTGGGGVYYTELHYFTLHFWLFLCMV